MAARCDRHGRVVLTEPQKRLLIESTPDDRTGQEGCGVEIQGSTIRAAQALERHGFGHVEGVGGSLPAMYWSNAEGLAERCRYADDPAEEYPADDGGES